MRNDILEVFQPTFNSSIIFSFSPTMLLMLYMPHSSFLFPSYTEDECFYPEPAHLEEYVLNTSGRIWTGTYNNHSVKPWHFGQFHQDSLEVALTLLEQVSLKERGNPILVCMHIIIHKYVILLK